MKKFLLFLASMAILLWADLAFGRAGFAPIPFFFVLLGGLAWFAEYSRPARLWIGAICGMFMDAFSLLPFGIYTALFILLAFMPEFFPAFLSSARPVLRILLTGASLAAAFLLLIPPASGIIGLIFT